MNEKMISYGATVCFAAAVLHTFLTSWIGHLASRMEKHSLAENLLHYFAEVEVVFGLWATLFLCFLAYIHGIPSAVSYLESVQFTEAAFVFVVMVMASTKPIMTACEGLSVSFVKIFPKSIQSLAYYGVALSFTPLLGSFITEPASIVISALLLQNLVFKKNSSNWIKYITFATLLVNTSIGGTLTHFAAPPVVMVSQAWGWDVSFMMQNFGWKSAVAIVINTSAAMLLNWKELKSSAVPMERSGVVPFWMTLSHVVFMALVVGYHHSMAFFIPLFLLFLGWTDVTKEYQSSLKLREALLVGFFLGGLVTLGQLQRWWIEPIILSLSPLKLFLGSTTLTAVTDNAALTYLGTLVPDLDHVSRYVLVAGAVAGGGLTLIANAPNPIALGLLKSSFQNSVVDPLKLLVAALFPTTVACLSLWFL